MSITFTGDAHQMQNSANQTAACCGELESHLKSLSFVQDELHAAVVSQGAGNAIYNTLGNAHTSGLSLAGTLQQIIDALNVAGVQVDAQDMEGAAHVNAVLGADGHVDGGTWANSAAAVSGFDTSKVDVSSWK
ncbi:hypothetical protein ACFYO1_02420 [Nocardia sp. NPDC006044]|uniref:hypothetical protein n=1 Tax=Nocardia sp. NPDC006044 TaxID=3364306 RepID=UPI0036C7B179